MWLSLRVTPRRAGRCRGATEGTSAVCALSAQRTEGWLLTQNLINEIFRLPSGGQRALRPQARFGGPLDGQCPSICKADPLVQLQTPLGFALLAITFS